MSKRRPRKVLDVNKELETYRGIIKMIPRSLKYWPIFSLLESKFISTIRMAVVYGASGNKALIVTKDRMVYALGEKNLGLLKIQSLCNKSIKTFAHCKDTFVVALTEEGEVYYWGQSSYSNLFGTYSSIENPIDIRNEIYGHVVEIACGHDNCLILVKGGKVYRWRKEDVQTYYAFEQTQQASNIQQVTGQLSAKIVGISCGHSYNVVVMDDGEVYSWGDNSFGQLGIGNDNYCEKPSRVTKLDGVVIEKVVCGYTHTLALSDEGVLYVWGANNYGQLGIGTEEGTSSPVKLEVSEMGTVLDIAASHYSHISVAMTNNGQVFIWGQCLNQNIKVPKLSQLRSFNDVFACFATPRIMHQPLLLHNERETNLVDSFKTAFDDSSTSDLVFNVRGKPIHVHKTILRMRCRYFNTMFQKQWVENNQSVIEHKEFSYETYRAFLKYLYTDEVDVPLENASELLTLADAYTQNQLKIRCVHIMKEAITVETVAFLYELSIKYEVGDLEESCFDFALKHMTAVVLTPNFFKLSEDVLRTFIIRAANANAFKT